MFTDLHGLEGTLFYGRIAQAPWDALAGSVDQVLRPLSPWLGVQASILPLPLCPFRWNLGYKYKICASYSIVLRNEEFSVLTVAVADPLRTDEGHGTELGLRTCASSNCEHPFFATFRACAMLICDG